MACRIDRLISDVVSMEQDASVQQAAELMMTRNVDYLVVMHGGSVVGLFTERDLLRRVVGRGVSPSHVTLGAACTRDLVSISHDSSCLEAVIKMRTRRCRRLVVYRGDQLAGLVNLPELASAVAESGGKRDMLVNILGGITFAVAVGVITMLILQLPEMLQLLESVKGP